MRYAILQCLGITRFWRWLGRSNITVLMIHGVMSAEHESSWVPIRWQMEPKVLDRYLTALKRKYEFIATNEAVSMILGDVPLRPRCMVVTIDDGYRNAYEHAWPVLSKHGIRPLVFVATSLIDNEKYYWFDQLDGVLQQAAKKVDRFEFLGETLRLDADDKLLMAKTCRRIIRKSRLVYSNDDARYKALGRLTEKLGIPADFIVTPKQAADTWIAVMGEDEIRAAKKAGMDVGSHTVSHARLPSISAKERQAELTVSKQHLEKILNHECEFFCYPEGAIDDESMAAVRAAGYRAAFAVHPKMPTVGSDSMRIGRVHLPRQVENAELMAVVSGLTDALQRLRPMLAGSLRALFGARKDVTQS